MRALIGVLILFAGVKAYAGCEGFAVNCSFAGFSRSSCEMQDGCFWDSFGEQCTGVAKSCDRFDNYLSCESQRGCEWRDTEATDVQEQ